MNAKQLLRLPGTERCSHSGDPGAERMWLHQVETLRGRVDPNLRRERGLKRNSAAATTGWAPGTRRRMALSAEARADARV